MVAERCPNAVRCADPFHVVGWATDALDEVRRQAWNQMRGAAAKTAGRPVHRRRTHAQTGPVRAVEEPGQPHRPPARQAGLDRQDRPPALPGLPAQGGTTARVPGQGRGRQAGAGQLDQLGPALPHPRLRQLQRRIVKHRAAIDATLDHNLSNGLVESTNTKIRLLTRVAFGFHKPEALIALAMLSLGGYCPPLPGRR